ncbi:hypothetical protein [uncultured Gammaproteobacteria bacterium]|nr:hypothetical protein [uncultured Gammaproteobacteria bacterium]
MATETIFNPKDNTTKEKFTSFEYVNSCYVRDRENLNKNVDFLGESKEVKQSYAISKNSLKQAHQSIHDDELKRALNDGAISREQVRNFKQSQHMLEMENKRESSLGKSRETGRSR